MPLKLLKKLQKEYQDKGYSAKKAKSVAYATLVKKGIIKHKSDK